MRVIVLKRTRDEGLTLVELLVSVTLLGIVLTAISGVTFVAVRTAAGADARLDDSNDLLRASTYFGDDVLSAQSASAATTPKCGTDSSVVIEFVGQDFLDTALTVTTTVVSYVLRPVTDSDGTRLQLRRLACTAATATPSYPLVPATDRTVARQLSSTAPTVVCTSTCAAFTQVSLTLRESGGLVYVLTGRRRVT